MFLRLCETSHGNLTCGKAKAREIMDLFDKCKKFTRSLEVKEMGIYPYFRPIASAADTVVTIHGQELIMIGAISQIWINTFIAISHTMTMT